MTKVMLLAIGFIAQWLNVSTLFAQSNPTQSLLWKVSGKNLKQASYLFGTIHAICADDYFFTPKMNEALSDSKKLLLEVDLSDATANIALQQQMMLPEGASLKDYFNSEEEYKSFAENVKKEFEIDVNFFSKFKPFMLISMLTMKSQTCETQSYEMNLMSTAKKQAIAIDGLETGISQLEIFDRMSKEEIKSMLQSTVQQADSAQNTFKTMINLYKNQDVEALYKLIASSPDIAGHESELISGRNVKWMNKLIYEMNDKTCFIAVGAGHLGGKKGLLQLLQDAGYTLEAVN